MEFVTTAWLYFPGARRDDIASLDWDEEVETCRTAQWTLEGPLICIKDHSAHQGLPAGVGLLERYRIDYDLHVEPSRHNDGYHEYVRFDEDGSRQHKRITQAISYRTLLIVREHLDIKDGIHHARWLLDQLLGDKQPLSPSLEDIAERYPGWFPF